MAKFLYVESDGQLFLVRRDGRLALPTPEEVAFEVEERVPLNFPDHDVVFCTPVDHRFRPDWLPKDKVPGLPDVDALVHRAVNASLVREVTGAMILDRDEILVVKASRGFTKGFWNIPGGFVLYGEAPEDGVRREVREEVGLEIEVVRPVGVYTMRFQSPYFLRAHVFLCRAATRETTPDPDEIAEVTWMSLDDAMRMTRNPFALQALREVKGQG
ncbi:MAG TPA: NUDIX hydrolase [Candidatus Thermoplasmatota archaeon]|nr:NUDIX hydrolase [Candidatus Thermoplasmatota archaeon]